MFIVCNFYRLHEMESFTLMVLLASEIKLLMSSSPFNSQSAGVLAGNKETYLYM